VWVLERELVPEPVWVPEWELVPEPVWELAKASSPLRTLKGEQTGLVPLGAFGVGR
jgi:hypothetical protein